MRKFILSDILWGTALALAALFFYFTQTGLETAELKFYDVRASMNAGAPERSDIAVIEINDDSISKIGRWPWSRSRIADMLVWLSSEPARPSVIGLNILFSEPEKNGGTQLADALKAKYTELVAEKKIRETGKESEFLKALEAERRSMDSDAKLADAVGAAGNVVLPLFFDTGIPVSKLKPEPEWMKRLAPSISHKAAAEGAAGVEGSGITAPIDVLASSAAGAGHVNVFSDIDGTVRKEYPFIPYGGQNYYPSFAAEIVRVSLGLAPDKVVLAPADSAAFGKSVMTLDQASSALIAYNRPKAFKYYSFYDVMNGKVVPEAFKDKIVLIGLTAQGVGSLYVTPTDSAMTTPDFTANVVDNILSGRFVSRPGWALPAEAGLILLMGLFTAFLLPRLKAGMGAIIAGVTLAALVGAGFVLFSKGLWFKTMYPAVVLVAGYIFVISKRFFLTEKKKELIEVSQIETNKMLGLSFQGQGMLDLAFEKFRLCPIDDNMKDTLYNLGLDFERKRQYNKAVAVYEHIGNVDGDFKDIKSKVDMLKKAADGAVFGGVGGKAGGAEATMMVAGSTATPMLGRYEIKKELGKGAMGIVYLGVDPKINRTVAIKTMRFEEGMDEKAMKEQKERFFREAQAAGNLQHPHIVKIYDAGEEQDIAYIAMELLKGDDLKKWAAKDNLLPVEKVLGYIADAADALGYAHKNGIVHRDIKPANIMLLEDGNIRVADFGIARITESSKTATGTVLGTPYYMSPEQIAGKKVDGRADLFSLGVTLYELLTGEKPWKGGESIGTLLFQITSDPYPDPMVIRKDLPPGILAVIDKALKKNPDERFQTGTEMAEAIRAVLAGKTPQLNAAPAPAPAPKPAAAPAPAAQTQPKLAAAPAAQTQPKPAAAPAAQTQPKPAASPAAQTQPKPAAAPAAKPGSTAPAGLELAPKAGNMNSPAAAPAAQPKPAPAAAPKPAPKPTGLDNGIPVIFPEEGKK